MVEVKLLGEFEVRRDGGILNVPEGKPSTLVRLVATAGGSVSDAAAIEAIWPGSPAVSGRRGLRNVLHRLRTAVGDLLLREGTYLHLHPRTSIDAASFERLASEALSSSDSERSEVLSRRALEFYRGDLLPRDADAPWTLLPRARLLELKVRLLDRLAEAEESRGQLEEAVELYERAIAADPHDERRYMLVARVLVSQGRQAKALHVLERGAVAMRGLGLPVPAAIATLSTKIRAGRATAEDFPEPVDLVYFPESMPWHTTPLSRAITMNC